MYDENSFLMGITVGRAMKGVTVQQPESGATVWGTLSIHPGLMIQTEATPPSEIQGTIGFETIAINIEGEIITASASVPELSNNVMSIQSALTPLALVSIIGENTAPDQIGAAITAEAVITIEE